MEKKRQGKRKVFKLRTLIILIVALTAFLTTFANWFSAISTLKYTLKENYLENNYQYANKIALSTNDLFISMQQNIASLAEALGRKELAQVDLDDWRRANQFYFYSIFTTDHEGVILMQSPEKIPGSNIKKGVKITTDLMKKALSEQKPFISDPYKAQSGNLVLLVSSPVFDQEGNYKGVVDGTIYLESNCALRTTVNKHMFLDETTVFVVDHSGRIIYHPEPERIGELIDDHPLIKNVIEGNSGSSQIINSRGVEYFSGYAPVQNTGWGIVVQTPVSVINEPLKSLTKDMIIEATPFLILTVLIAAILTNILARPLNILAKYSEEAIRFNQTPDRMIRLPDNSHIYEVTQLYKQLKRHFQLLSDQIQKDGLTGLANRRTFDEDIKRHVLMKNPFSLIMIDIDNFKKVNDTYGHLVGDDVLRFLSRLIQNTIRENDRCYRYGGEEFAIICEVSDEEAFKIAERLRETIASTPSPTGKPITVSLGVATLSDGDVNVEQIIDRADFALYQSKRKGKNRTTIYGE